jgi:YD repeat-containing protein
MARHIDAYRALWRSLACTSLADAGPSSSRTGRPVLLVGGGRARPPDDKHHDQDPARPADARDDDRRSVGAVPHVYDTSGKVVGRSATDSAGTVTNYDARGKVIGRETTTGNTTTIYDAGGRNVGRFNTMK